ncbi:NifU family protein [Dactylosporangium vinaceum]|uniref:NifU family protein n=1 Tax=Dactylosporangium vinaceum TaxID=53362 RepID=A0ABV5M2A1_9ACTN|nr:NifU family protein [Dactylosporangium vinaceum]UAC02414.1 NifU family protein [Dactylosporangium vinaceum]
MIPIHPQSCPGEPDRLRWMTPAGVLTFTGPAAAVPDPLAGLLTDGTLAEVHVEPDAIVTVLGTGRDWTRDGARIRSALHAALADRGGWLPAGRAATADDVLHATARELIDGAVGDLARSHGGAIELVTVHDGVVTVRLTGACHGCPAAESTLRHQLEDRLRRRCPDLRAVTADGPPQQDPTGGGAKPWHRALTLIRR